ncbi:MULTISPECIES: acetyltransferase [Prochlorococcus]|uniref:Acetyltransferase, GNAT family n=1 Tax=Prochlorococcus marinus (strain SARG / CCMP1375 / SS120) TaxID=167539 RepID=Q7V9H3_PROMA|nr:MULTISPECIES: acetyltransferase [Prochlorococcus]AAQ00904.1 Acetyltransferase, GNAT family [Prochlorococcus marinus subsp. marinus str. CCMP1375]KGG10601.1 GCN5-related N-acetyltransferase [Prochlorococcus marinus str. LG]KGG19933.1 GCN5-related N-acetyltransferase [Prochlorococcus marinus str. SS2]KGG23847.1 GCN5-related N-acetyltransferase [Prochlorococcus marinus str. SS35]KGG31893.1 GCN5-related N-acetyltransferase [Prochlorococcus marinus str. SS51]
MTKAEQNNFDVHLRPIKNLDHLVLREVYTDAIVSQGSVFYSNDQIEAWRGLAFLPGVLDKPIEDGKGWLAVKQNQVEAFGLRYPSDRLALLYCRGRSMRKGYATKLLQKIELDAFQEGITTLFTEASLFSHPLLLRSGWVEISIEKIEIASIPFDRFRMLKKL